MYYLGIDGGGTKTAFEIIDERGVILSSVKTSTCDYIQIGKGNYRKHIAEGTEAVCAKAHLTKGDLNFTCIGIPSFGEIAGDVPELIRLTQEALESEAVKCVNDVEVGWAGSLGCTPGINLLAGTGALGFGKDNKGNAVRSGGWGNFCGDEGSAYWLGKKLIELFTKQADGRLKKSKVYDVVKSEYQLKEDFDFLPIVHGIMKQRDEIAKLQLLLYRAAMQGDGGAADMYCKAANELSLLLFAVYDQLEFDAEEPVTVSYSGGVFKAGDLILRPLEEIIGNHRFVVKKPLLSPVTGAALYALIQHGSYDSTGLVSKLHEQNLSSGAI